jgi:hypothetical protein
LEGAAEGRIAMIKNALLAIWKSLKSNSAALIIGAAIIIGLNFSRFLGGAQSILYEISGQAARDQESAKQAKNQQAIQLQARKIVTEAWNSFLLANRGNDNPEIKVVQSTSGDFVCMDFLRAGNNDRMDHFADMFTKYLNQNAILGRTDWTYELLDNDFFSDAYTANLSKDLKYNRGYGSCNVPNYLYRRNRYQQHLELH